MNAFKIFTAGFVSTILFHQGLLALGLLLNAAWGLGVALLSSLARFRAYA